MNFILLCLAGWINRKQQAIIEYLLEEVRVLKQIHGKRPTFNDDQRRRLAVKAKKLRYGKLKETVTMFFSSYDWRLGKFRSRGLQGQPTDFGWSR